MPLVRYRHDFQIDEAIDAAVVASGGGDMLAANNLSDVANAATARTNLGLAIGTDVQAYDADLATWAGLTPSANGQSLVTAANYAAMRGLLDLEAGTDFYSIAAADAAFLSQAEGDAAYQPLDADLTTWAGVTSSANGRSLVSAADYAAMRALLDLEVGVDVQAYDADLTTWAGLTPSANAQSLVTAANYAAMRTLLDLEAGTDFYSIAAANAAFQPLDGDLTSIAALSTTAYGRGLLELADETALEALLDTLPNLTSIQGRTVTLADAGADALFAWDDSASAYQNLSAADATAVLSAFVGDAGAGGTKGLVPAPGIGDSTKALFGDGTWQAIPGGGDALTSGNLSQFAATTSLQLKGVMSDETGSGALVFADTPTLVTPVIGAATGTSLGLSGTLSTTNGAIDATVSGSVVGIFNRTTNDGAIIALQQAGTQEGSISVSGTTVAYNTFLGAHWSQFEKHAKPSLLPGTVLESVDSMCEWLVAEPLDGGERRDYTGTAKPGETVELECLAYRVDAVQSDKLPRCKISDTALSPSVYGVFLAWNVDDSDRDGDLSIASLGSYRVRIAKGVKVKRGDFLVSAGDGTARPQMDDLLRSSTIGKVTSATAIETYSDGSYTVPCTLHCG